MIKKTKVNLQICVDNACHQGTLVSSTNKTDRHDILEILLKVLLTLTPNPLKFHVLRCVFHLFCGVII